MSNLKKQIQELKMALAKERGDNPVQVTENGNLSVYIPGRKFPVTASLEAWSFILDHTDKLSEAVTGGMESKSVANG